MVRKPHFCLFPALFGPAFSRFFATWVCTCFWVLSRSVFGGHMGSKMEAFSDHFRQKWVQKACLKKHAFLSPHFSSHPRPPVVQKPRLAPASPSRFPPNPLPKNPHGTPRNSRWLMLKPLSVNHEAHDTGPAGFPQTPFLKILTDPNTTPAGSC